MTVHINEQVPIAAPDRSGVPLNPLFRDLRETLQLETRAPGAEIQCNADGEWTVWYGKQPKSAPLPIQQASPQAIVLRRWLETNGYAYLEVLPLVLVAPTASVDRRQMPDDVTIVKWDQFDDWWERETANLGALSMVKMGESAFLEKRDTALLRELGEKMCRAQCLF